MDSHEYDSKNSHPTPSSSQANWNPINPTFPNYPNTMEKDSSSSSSSPSYYPHLVRHINECGALSMEPKHTQFQEFGVKPFTYSYERAKEGLCKLFVQTELPFSFAQDYEFNEFIQTSLQPQHRPISTKEMRATLKRLYKEYKYKLITELSNLDCRVSLTVDVWEFNTVYHFLCITCHWIDSSWMLQKRIIAFRMLEFPQTSSNMCDIMIQAINTYDIRSKIMAITFDDTSSMTVDDSILRQNLRDVLLDGATLHVKCACHILNLCVKDVQTALVDIYQKIRHVILYINSSSLRVQEWKKLCQSMNYTPRKLPLDFPALWNLTYNMLSVALEYKEPLTQFGNQIFPPVSILESDWEKAKHYMKFFKLFYDFTSLFSSVYTLTSNNFLPAIVLIAQLFSQYRQTELGAFLQSNGSTSFLREMEGKVKKYLEEIPIIFIFASILDPRCKFEGTCSFIEFVIEVLELDIDFDKYKLDLENAFSGLYNLYDSRIGNSTRNVPILRQGTSSSVSQPNVISQIITTLLRQHRQGKETTRTNSSMSELQIYLKFDCFRGMSDEEMENIDILAWWHSHKNFYPVLSAMARDILSAQASSIASERAFDEFGRVLDEKIATLNHPNTLHMRMCYKDWLDADKRKQGQRGRICFETDSDDE